MEDMELEAICNAHILPGNKPSVYSTVACTYVMEACSE